MMKTASFFAGLQGFLSKHFLPLGGGTMAGDIAMGGHKVTGLAEPVDDADAATKKYAEDLFGTWEGGVYKVQFPDAGQNTSLEFYYNDTLKLLSIFGSFLIAGNVSYSTSSSVLPEKLRPKQTIQLRGVASTYIGKDARGIINTDGTFTVAISDNTNSGGSSIGISCMLYVPDYR